MVLTERSPGNEAVIQQDNEMSTRSKQKPPRESEPLLIGYDELSARTDISRRTWERRVCEGKVPGLVKVGHAVRFNWPIVKAWLDRGGNG